MYAVVSYALAHRNVPARPVHRTAREWLREIWAVVTTQPLLPYYYLGGRVLARGSDGRVPVVFVHGYFQNRVDFARMAVDLGHGATAFGFNYPWWRSVEKNGARLAAFVDEVLAETGATSVDIVAHSMGGLVSRAALGHGARVRRLVTIASPHRGILYRGPVLGQGGEDLRAGSPFLTRVNAEPIGVPTLSLASTHDNMVHPHGQSQLDALGGDDLLVGEMGHLAILFAPETVTAVRAFLTMKGAGGVYPRGEMTGIFSATSPVDAQPLEDVLATPDDAFEGIVAKAREAQAAWSKLGVEARARALRPLAKRLLARAEAVANLVHREVGKPEVEALLGEVLPSADVVSYWTLNAPELLEASEVELDPVTFPGKSAWIHREARGVVLLIQPWNFPFALPLRTLVPALLAGNAVVFKPSEVSPRVGALLHEMFEGLVPAGLVGLVQGGREAGEALCKLDVDLVVFTGSVAAGRKVAHACAERLVPCALELGGKDAAIVLADANLERAANGIVWGALVNAGQNCAAIERVYVDKKVAKDLTDRIAAAVKALRPGVDVGPLATARQRATVLGHVDEAKKSGAEVLSGGQVFGEGHGYEPTVLRVSSDDGPLMQEETFGPLIPIAEVEDVDEAIRRANASRFGLTASIWSRDTKTAARLAHRLRAGVVTVNNHAFTGAIPAAPWSGVGETGWGITNSPLALDALTRPRMVLVDRAGAAHELWWYPYTPTLRRIAIALARLRSGSLLGRIGAVFTLLGAVPRRLLGRDRGEG